MTNQNLQQLRIIAVNGRYVEYDGKPLCPDAIYDDCKYPNLNPSALLTLCVGDYVQCPTRKSRVLRGVANNPSLNEQRTSQEQVHIREKIKGSQERKPEVKLGGKI